MFDYQYENNNNKTKIAEVYAMSVYHLNKTIDKFFIVKISLIFFCFTD